MNNTYQLDFCALWEQPVAVMGVLGQPFRLTFQKHHLIGPIILPACLPGDTVSITLITIDSTTQIPQTNFSSPKARLNFAATRPLSKCLEFARNGGYFSQFGLQPGDTLYLPVYQPGGQLVLGSLPHALPSIVVEFNIHHDYPLEWPRVENDPLVKIYAVHSNQDILAQQLQREGLHWFQTASPCTQKKAAGLLAENHDLNMIPTSSGQLGEIVLKKSGTSI